jgi:CheY-like chemotaxis protein/glycine cleavage system H lipoate-binding protein
LPERDTLMSNEPMLLVVDDEDAICEGCRRIFSRQGFAVQKCNSATQGLDLATHTDFSAILLDIKMPEMDGLHFLESLRKEKPEVPVVLMTGYPSIPNAASAIRLGASDYVTKPFTPEEISQAVHRLLQQEPTEAAAAQTAATEPPAGSVHFRFYGDAWYQEADEGAVRVGAMVVRPGVSKIESVRVPRIGEVVYQGLPLAAVTVSGQSQRTIPAPLSGVVVAVNDAIESNPGLLLSDPCSLGWIASISPTRLDEESTRCQQRRVILLSQNRETAAEQEKKMRWMGCDVRTISEPRDVDAVSKSFETNVLLFDGATFGMAPASSARSMPRTQRSRSWCSCHPMAFSSRPIVFDAFSTMPSSRLPTARLPTFWPQRSNRRRPLRRINTVSSLKCWAASRSRTTIGRAFG